ncbi:hypothetical protein [Candidatus Bathycorpusculum sp.]|jgi:hypothetical protein|uniref:hypothetical protein n=1 Tax=Candidatus Bathycorpusculum sp. TaxID=2994959 RepID=UPI002838CF38|nr:hypothetical protein [Candidatus Termitimicrobium sp.]MCL2686529.1 hypothetical protein [Candidatus Termitimicrobium sp.]
MAGLGKTLLKKIFSLALIFNALISIATVAGILYAYYRSYPYWQPYKPYLLSASLFWLALAAAAINIFHSAAIGRVLHIHRVLFHHYVYAIFAIIITSAYVVFFTPVSLHTLFFVDNSSVAVNVGRAFMLGGIALLLDDLPDVSKYMETGLNWLKTQACRVKMALHISQFITGIFAFYCSFSILLSTIQNNGRALPNSFVIVSLFITGITSFALVKRRSWLTIMPPEPQAPKLFV